MLRSHKKMYYCVQSCFYTDGRVEARIIRHVARRRKPQDLYEKRRKYDIYEDWFESRSKAEMFAQGCRDISEEERPLYYLAVTA